MRAWVLALVLYPLLGVSLGLYYNLTFFGTAAVPIPEPVSLLGPLLYYLAGSVHLTPAWQAAAWVGSFWVTGLLWLGALELVARRRGFRPDIAIVASCTPLLLPAPWLLYLHGVGPEGFSWDACITACLIRKFGLSPLVLEQSVAGLGPLVLALGALAGGCSLFRWMRIAGPRGFLSYAAALGLALVVTVGLSGLFKAF